MWDDIKAKKEIDIREGGNGTALTLILLAAIVVGMAIMAVELVGAINVVNSILGG
jgi:multisubunit Na+/H+ antiporter MnhC subunit